jgi:hypothetical protein
VSSAKVAGKSSSQAKRDWVEEEESMKKHKHRPGRVRPLVRGGWYPKSMVKQFSPQRNDFHWNANFTKFKPMPLRWWDDSSYARYQSDDGDYGIDQANDYYERHQPKTAYGRRMKLSRARRSR